MQHSASRGERKIWARLLAAFRMDTVVAVCGNFPQRHGHSFKYVYIWNVYMSGAWKKEVALPDEGQIFPEVFIFRPQPCDRRLQVREHSFCGSSL
jgi:hypothetical protein